MKRLLTLLACAAVALAAGCGSDDEGDPIPENLAAAMQDQLDRIQGQIENGTLGACEDVLEPENTFATLESVADQVPNSVGEDVRDALRQSVDRLRELVQERCSELEREANQEETTEPPVEEEPTDTETTEVPTVTEEVPPPEEEEEPTEDPSQGPGNGNGNGNGNGPPSGGTPPGNSGGIPAPGDEG